LDNAGLLIAAADFPGDGFSRLPVADGAGSSDQAAARRIGARQEKEKACQLNDSLGFSLSPEERGNDAGEHASK
jgi:hypothetical protein